MLRSKLYQRKMQEQEQLKSNLYAQKGDTAWGNQIRSYVFQPYQIIKDLRTGHQISDVDRVMNGDL